VEWFRDQKVAFLGVSSDENLFSAQRFAPSGWTFWWDGGSQHGPIALQYGVYEYPVLFVIDPQGRLVERFEKQAFNHHLVPRLVARVLQCLLQQPSRETSLSSSWEGRPAAGRRPLAGQVVGDGG
jgi:hypothetical protein